MSLLLFYSIDDETGQQQTNTTTTHNSKETGQDCTTATPAGNFLLAQIERTVQPPNFA